MDINLLRSSGVNSYIQCPFKFFLEYVVGLKSLSGKPALKGTIIHQVLQWIAEFKKTGKQEPSYLSLLDWAWDLYVSRNPHITMKKTKFKAKIETADYKFCRKSISKIMDSPYNLFNLNILETEKPFKIPMPGKEWNGFCIKGTIDLIHEINCDTIEIIDYKTGLNSTKNYYQLIKEIQPRMYHLACSILYPQYKNIIVTFNYVNDTGPTTFMFTNQQMTATIEYIWNLYNHIKDAKILKRNRIDTCYRMCYFGKRSKDKCKCDIMWPDVKNLNANDPETIEYIKRKYE